MNPHYSRYYTYIKPFLKNKAVKTYSSLVFSLIMITIFSLFAIKPTLSTIVSLQKSIKEQQQTLDSITKKGEGLSQAKSNYEALNDGVKTNLALLVPTSTSLTDLLASISNLAIFHEATISGLQVQPTMLEGDPIKLSKDATIKEINFTANFQGSYQSLSNLLDAFSQSPRLIYIQAVNFNKQSDDPLIMTVNAKGYYIKN